MERVVMSISRLCLRPLNLRNRERRSCCETILPGFKLPFTAAGEEIGSWDGDTLVIDSIGFKDTKTWADENADPHSDALHTVERWTRPDAGHLHLELTIEDPKYYKQPIHFQRTWVAAPGQHTREQACTENNIDVSAGHPGYGPGPIRADGTRGYDNPAPLPPPPSKANPAKTILPPNFQ
jgi:hypothetical protein